jgi:hypothetical protein
MSNIGLVSKKIPHAKTARGLLPPDGEAKLTATNGNEVTGGRKQATRDVFALPPEKPGRAVPKIVC